MGFILQHVWEQFSRGFHLMPTHHLVRSPAPGFEVASRRAGLRVGAMVGAGSVALWSLPAVTWSWNRRKVCASGPALSGNPLPVSQGPPSGWGIQEKGPNLWLSLAGTGCCSLSHPFSSSWAAALPANQSCLVPGLGFWNQ